MALVKNGNIKLAPLQDPPPSFSLDNALAQELLKLTLKDRIEHQEELHGARCRSPEESGEFVDQKQREFDHLLMDSKIRGTETTRKLLANVESIFYNQPFGLRFENSRFSCYLNDPKIRLRFLRCECFDARKAVQRLVQFLDLGSELYGDFVTQRPISILDFSKQEEQALKNSRNQYLPFRDRSGRRVLVGVGSCDFNLDAELRYKILLFLHWVVSEDEETQQKGVVIVGWPFNERENENTNTWEEIIRPSLSQKTVRLHNKLDRSNPVRVVSTQLYYADTPFFRALSGLYYTGMEARQRSVYKVHYGEATELRYAMIGYGIQEQLIPLSATGTVKTSTHSRWINSLYARARSMNKDEFKDVLDCPRSNDVVFRKGPTFKNNPGNMYFRELIEASHHEHKEGSRQKKCDITWKVIEAIEKRNGRFLSWCPKREMWIVAKDREKIRTKVAAHFKHYNKMDASRRQNDLKLSSVSVIRPTHDYSIHDMTSSKRQKLCSDPCLCLRPAVPARQQ